MPPRVYLAGPDVFFPEAAAWGERKRAICLAYSLAGVMPLDPLEHEPPEWDVLPEADRIARRNEAHIHACDAVLANLTPFRGASADSGTVYEVGYARGLGRPVFGYTTTSLNFTDRTRAGWGNDGLAIEAFGLQDNLMIDCAVRHSGGMVVHEAGERRWTDLAAFERCVALAASALLGKAPQRLADAGLVGQAAQRE